MGTDDGLAPAPPNFSLTRRRAAHAWRLALILVWSLWWGGLTFYATLVVPVATEELGSVAQGFVTRRVTAWHNGMTLVVLVLFAIESYLRRSRWLVGLVGGLALDLVALFLDHHRLTGLMDFSTRSVPDGFYNEHAIYLWLTTVEWCAGGLLLFWLPRRKHPE